MTIEDGTVSTLRLGDGQKLLLGTDEDGSLQFDGSNIYLDTTTGEVRISRYGTGRFRAVTAGLDLFGNRLIQALTQIRNWSAYDSAPDHEVGRLVLASPAWDPDGDGNGELVMSDGTAWNEVVDLPNYV